MSGGEDGGGDDEVVGASVDDPGSKYAWEMMGDGGFVDSVESARSSDK